MPFSSMSRRALLGAATVGLAAGGPALAQSDELAGIPDIERLTQQEQATYRRRLRDASGDQERARIREEARRHAEGRAQLRHDSGQDGGRGRGSGGDQGGGNPRGSGGQGGGRGQAPRRIPGGGGRSN